MIFIKSSYRYYLRSAISALRIICVLLVLLMIASQSYSQTYALPDTNLRNKLQRDYPTFMTGGELNITAASGYRGELFLQNSNISDASGVQFFTNIVTLNLNNNRLTSLPDISGLIFLKNLYLNSNNIASLADLPSLPSLRDFQVQNNQMKVLPSFQGMTSLVNFYCQNNSITSLPDLSQMQNLQILAVGNNPLASLPNLSSFINLRELHVHQTGIDTIKGLSALMNLEHLYAWGNKIRDLSGLNNNVKLRTFQVSGNNMKSLTTLSNKPWLSYTDFSHNNLTFEDILPLLSHPSFRGFDIAPQKRIPLESYSVKEHESVTISLDIDRGVGNNSYAWFKDGTWIQTNQTGSLVLPSVTMDDAAGYYCVITNPDVPQLHIKTTVSQVTVRSCFEINDFSVSVLSSDCSEGSSIKFVLPSFQGGLAPYQYKLIRADRTDSLTSSSTGFEAVPPGVYVLKVTDSKNCEAVTDQITVESQKDCDRVFTPNGDGIMDTYFIPDSGYVKIYDSQRKLITEFIAPGLWDGSTKQGGEALPGYYAIIIDGKKVKHITLIK